MTPFIQKSQKSQKYQLGLMGLRNLRRRDGGGKGEAPPRFKSVPKVPKPLRWDGTDLGPNYCFIVTPFTKEKGPTLGFSCRRRAAVRRNPLFCLLILKTKAKGNSDEHSRNADAEIEVGKR